MYKAIIVKLNNVRKHPNADKILLATVYGSQIIVGLNSKEDDIGIYFPCDGKLSPGFCEANGLIGYKDEKTGERKGGYFDNKMNVRCQKFRGEKSDGFFIPLDSLSYTGGDITNLREGDQFDIFNGMKICEKYISRSTRHHGMGSAKNMKKKTKEFITFHEHIDTQQFMYNVGKIPKGSLITIAEKCHGTSARSSFAKCEYILPLWKRVINFIRPGIFKLSNWEYVTGTRRVVLDNEKIKSDSGHYSTNLFREKYHKLFKNNLRKGETVYYEIVGWVSLNSPIMPIGNNVLTKDKEFIKKYGETTTFKYGCVNGESDIFVYRISMSNEDGIEIDYSWKAIKKRCSELGVKYVPELAEQFLYDGDKENLIKKVESFLDGSSTVDPTHIREGVVIRVENGTDFEAYKMKNWHFKVLEGIIKDTDVVDIEEAQDVPEQANNNQDGENEKAK